jgi:hypothetical protein
VSSRAAIEKGAEAAPQGDTPDPPGPKLGGKSVKKRVGELAATPEYGNRISKALEHGDRAKIARDMTAKLWQEGFITNKDTVARYLRNY